MLKKPFLLPVLGLLLLVLIPACLFLFLGYHLQDRIIHGVSVQGHNLGGIPLTDAAVIIEEAAQGLESQVLQYYYGDRTWQVIPRELGIHVDRNALLEQASEIGCRGSLWEQIQERWRAWRRGTELTVPLLVEEKEREEHFLALAREVNESPRNASLDLDTMAILPECPGRQLDAEATFELLAGELKHPRTGWVALQVKEIEPATSRKEIISLGNISILGRATTPFDPDDANRSVNLQEAVAALDGTLLAPEEILSFNQVVGPREPEYGYLEAPELVGLELVPGYGGGVCQVSSTLFHAALLAGVRVVERHSHSRPSTYIPLGLDAAVAYEYLDLKLLNVGINPLLLAARIRDAEVEVAILGKRWGPEEIYLEVGEIKEIPMPIEQIIDPTLVPGEYIEEEAGAPGYSVTIQRITSLEGREIKREIASKSYYAPRPRIIRTGVLATEPDAA